MGVAVQQQFIDYLKQRSPSDSTAIGRLTRFAPALTDVCATRMLAMLRREPGLVDDFIGDLNQEMRDSVSNATIPPRFAFIRICNELLGGLTKRNIAAQRENSSMTWRSTTNLTLVVGD